MIKGTRELCISKVHNCQYEQMMLHPDKGTKGPQQKISLGWQHSH